MRAPAQQSEQQSCLGVTAQQVCDKERDGRTAKGKGNGGPMGAR